MAKFTGKAGSDTLIGTAFGDYIAGLGGNDSLDGGAGPDTLDGGTGVDKLTGGTGNDTYVVDATKDIINDAGGGDDRARASISVDLTLSRFDGIEHATMIGTAALKITGDAGNNMLVGNGGANVLNGGDGVDTLIGGDGNDSYIIDTTTDVLIEYPGGGIDTVTSQVATTYQLADNIENLIIGAAGKNGEGNELANKITGNAQNNSLFGNDGNDIIVGGGGTADNLSGGEGNDRLTAGSGLDQLSGGTGADSMTGGAGSDHYFVDDKGDKVFESAGATAGLEDEVVSSISYTLGANLEALTLTNAGTVGTGNGLANGIEGQVGSNTLQGAAGNDTLDGGVDADLVFGGLGDDEIRASGADDTLVGGAGKDKYTATAGAGFVADGIMDFDMGADRIDLTTGLTGYTGANLADYVKTAVVGGHTIVSIDFDGGGVLTFQETFRLIGIATDIDGLLTQGSLVLNPLPPLGFAPPTGDAGNNTLIGLDQSELMRGLGGNDSLVGNFGFDTLDGGTGADTMVGGNGSDTYVVDSAKDVITETSGADDRIRAAVSIDLTKYIGVEHATLTGTGALKATGDAGANMLIGNSGNNTLDGGAGANTLIGGAGNDVYVLGNSVDPETITELDGEGIDTIVTTGADTTLAANVENLTITARILGSDQNGTGNDLANKIVALPFNGVGNSSSNILSGLGGNDTLDSGGKDDTLNGGAGADRMLGGKGADTYVVDDIGDKITETGADTDTVVSFISHTLAANLENLTLAGVFDINGTGNALKNILTGSDGDNVLLGLGGDDVIFASLGADSLAGGAGKDSYKAESSIAVGPADKIFDFEMGTDTIDLTGVLVGLTGSNLADYVQTAIVNGNTIVSIDFDGVGGAQPVFEIVGIGTDVTGLRLNGSLALDIAAALPAQPEGTAAAETLMGTAATNLLRGLGGNDTLLGGDGANTLDGGTGKDSMEGGVGNDTYVVDSIGDIILDAAGTDDRIRATIAIDLTQAKYDGIEHVTLIGAAALAAKGDEFGNQLVGNNAGNKLDGGLGTDTLIGGLGNDVYFVNDAADSIFELPGGGTDSVTSTSAAYTLAEGIEFLTLAVGAGNGMGNALNNKIAGNITANKLAGADGNDNIAGNNGNDTLLGDGGNDILNGGNDNDSLTGGDGNDNLSGGSGNDKLNGGIGNDTMNGGAGNDEYTVDSLSDRIIDSGGADLVFSLVEGYVLANGLENLTLLGNTDLGIGNAGANAMNGTGSGNTLSGLGGNDVLFGAGAGDRLLGGTGNDTLIGGANADTLVGGTGSDRFRLEGTAIDAADLIADFQMGAGGDILDLGGVLIGTPLEREIVGNFVQTVESGGNTIVRVDIDGLGGSFGFVDAFVLQGVNTDVEGLVTGGNVSTALPA